MTYNASIPQPTDLISNSQPQLLANFSQLNTQFGIDHTAFNTGSGNGDGFHKKVTLANVSAPGTPVSPITVIFSKTVSTKQELHFINDTATTQITSGGLPIWKGGTVGDTGVVTLAGTSNGKIVLPNGLTYIWGVISAPSSGTSTQTFAQSGFATACFNVQLTGARAASSSVQSLYIDSTAAGGFTNGLSKTQFKLTCTSGSFTQVYYFAVGN